MLVYPTIKEAPIAGLSGFGGGASGLVQGAAAKVWTVGNLADWNFISNLTSSPYNYDTSGNGGVHTASIDGNAATAVTHSNNTGGWSMAYSSASISTDRPTDVTFKMNPYSGNAWFGLGLLLPNNTTFTTVVRDQSGQQGCFWQVTDSNTNNTDSALDSMSGITTNITTDTVCKLIINPTAAEQNGVAAGKIALYVGSTLDQTVTMTSDFISHIENGEVYAITDNYSSGKFILQRATYS